LQIVFVLDSDVFEQVVHFVADDQFDAVDKMRIFEKLYAELMICHDTVAIVVERQIGRAFLNAMVPVV